MKSKKYLIPECAHRSGFYPNFFFNIKRIKYEAIFTESCLYVFDNEDDADVNKLFGLSFGFHHKNSVRFGWNNDGDNIAIYTYCYKQGERQIKKILSIPINSKHTFEINVFESYYEMKIFNNEGGLIGWENIERAKTINCGYKLFPNFEGNQPAPHDIKIWMKRII